MHQSNLLHLWGMSGKGMYAHSLGLGVYNKIGCQVTNSKEQSESPKPFMYETPVQLLTKESLYYWFPSLKSKNLTTLNTSHWFFPIIATAGKNFHSHNSVNFQQIVMELQLPIGLEKVKP